MDVYPLAMENYKGYTIERIELLPNQYRYIWYLEDEESAPMVDTIEDAKGCIDYAVYCPTELHMPSLIQNTQDLISEINFAQKGTVIIQDIELEGGNRYRISVTMDLIKTP